MKRSVRDVLGRIGQLEKLLEERRQASESLADLTTEQLVALLEWSEGGSWPEGVPPPASDDYERACAKLAQLVPIKSLTSRELHALLCFASDGEGGEQPSCAANHGEAG